MIRSFDQSAFDAAIQEKDYIKIKNYIINSIRNNPGFKRLDGQEICEAREAFQKLLNQKAELPGLFSPYQLQNGEIEFDEENKGNWDEEYFTRQTFFLGENFCKERFRNIFKIGQYLEKQNFTDPQEKSEESGNCKEIETSSEMKTNITDYMPLVVLVFVIVAGIIILVGKMADIKWLTISGICVLAGICLIAIWKWFKRR